MDQNGKEEKQKLPNCSVITAVNDDSLKDIFHQIRTSKTTAVINYGASWYVQNFHKGAMFAARYSLHFVT
ncbi:unnamed protein product [Cuscuta campestris]|uniref:Uncharacterized protein n=1 Tax=Cuscuta campestris TaxID=132261 RepID=A0A484LT43_9ASTE|nr:unnamed protein product [Cuscuta campestris]